MLLLQNIFLAHLSENNYIYNIKKCFATNSVNDSRQFDSKYEIQFYLCVKNNAWNCTWSMIQSEKICLNEFKKVEFKISSAVHGHGWIENSGSLSSTLCAQFFVHLFRITIHREKWNDKKQLSALHI